MMRQPIVKTLALGALGVVALTFPAMAEDTKGKWQFGFGLSYMSTMDYIRSNSDVAFAGGLPGENGLPGVDYVDPRPDANILNRGSIRDDFKLDLSASYGLTRWLAVEASVGYMDTPVGNIEYYTENSDFPSLPAPTPSTSPFCGPGQNALCYVYGTDSTITTKTNVFLPVGQITEMPVQLSALVRFRPESPFDPYLGVGAGYIFTNLKTSGQFEETSAVIQSLSVGTAFEGEVVTGQKDQEKNAIFPGFTPKPLTATVNSAWEYHAIGGVDYYINERFSFYAEARYIWTGGSVDIRADGEHQVDLSANDLGRLNLQTQVLDPDPAHSTEAYLWEDRGFNGCVVSGVQGIPDGTSCSRDMFFETEDKNGNGSLDVAQGEDDGNIYVFRAGPGPGPFGQGWGNDTSRAIGHFFCPGCVGNGGGPDSEDRNQNLFLDRFLLYGVDICSTPQGAGNPLCSGVNVPANAYVWPEGCSQSHPMPPAFLMEGCPTPPPPGNFVPNSGVDNLVDRYVVQGGSIRLGGFSIGFGMKFTF